MLVLTFDTNGKAIITHAGEQLVVVFKEQKGNKSRAAFDGPRSFQIDREEVHQRKRKSQRAA